MARNLIERIDARAQHAPEQIAHISGGRTLTYAELARRSNAVAQFLARTLPDAHAPVAVWGHKEPEMLVAFLGAVKSGHPYIPIDASIPAQRRERIIALAGAPLLLTPEKIAALAPSDDAPDYTMQRDDPYYVIFTSGSTGEPKGVVITLGCLESFVEWILNEHSFSETREIFLNQAPFSFDLSVMDLYGALATGGTLFSITADEIANPKKLYQAFAQSQVTTWVSTPSFAQMCLAEKTFARPMLPKVKRFLFCGETLPPEVAAQLLQRFPGAQVWNTYGPTEATCATTSLRVDENILAKYSPLPVGYPKPGTRVVVLNEKGEGGAEGSRGEIVIAGSNVSPGYLGNAEQTARAFFKLDGERAYRTGDWGRYRDGMLFFEGRMDHQVKVHGYRIELGDVEENLRALEKIRDAVVIPQMKNGAADALAAFVVLTSRDAESEFELSLQLRRALSARLPSYMLPRKFYFLDALPMTPNGKADRRKLAELLQ